MKTVYVIIGITLFLAACAINYLPVCTDNCHQGSASATGSGGSRTISDGDESYSPNRSIAR